MLFVEGNLPTISICVLVVGASYLLALLASLKGQDTPRMGDWQAGKSGKLSRVASDLSTRIEVIAHNDNLTQRETEILHLLVQGKTLSAIQTELVIAGGTARTHITHIYEKLGVHSRPELMSLFL
jgi:DNA-binding CsgD family transcriptional regulator